MKMCSQGRDSLDPFGRSSRSAYRSLPATHCFLTLLQPRSHEVSLLYGHFEVENADVLHKSHCVVSAHPHKTQKHKLL